MSHLRHLVGRFFRSLRARRPGIDDQEFVATHLNGPQTEVFWQQPVIDLDHALRGAHHVAAAAPDRTDLIRAFLLHDVGKRHARLGVAGRSIATALRLVGLPTGRRGRAYLDHGQIGADELGTLGSDVITVAFARHHHEGPPAGIDPVDWALLVAADHH